MNILDDYAKALQALYAHVGFTEDWTAYPVLDGTDYHWMFLGNRKVRYSLYLEYLLDEDEGIYYEATIFKNPYYSDHVYRGEEYTMIFADVSNPNTVEGKYFMFFSNNKEYKGR